MPEANINPALHAITYPMDRMRPHPENYNKHDIGKIKDSLKKNGQYRAIVVDASTGYILAGNGTYAAARSLGWDKIAAELIEVTEEQARRILLVDNFAATDDYDLEGVVAILRELNDDLSGTGINASDYEDLLAKLDPQGSGDNGKEVTMSEAYGYAVIIEADDEQHQADLLEEFEGRGLTCRAFTS